MLKPLDILGDGTPLNLPGAKLRYYESFFNKKEASNYFIEILNTTTWKQDKIKVYGKTYMQPRLTALYANNALPYSYSGIKMHPEKLTHILSEIQNRIHKVSNDIFTTVLINQYRNGNDSNGWHADNEKELGKNPIIASVSFGSDRFFHLKHREQKELRFKILLKSGSLFFMEGETQTHWLHQIAKTSQPVGTRINLTFRKII